MSVLIKGMEMPKDCVSCQWHARWGCEITGIVTNGAQGCPLVEVPTPHGRLIDADTLMERIEASWKDCGLHGTDYHKIKRWINAAPTIIEAEEGTKI